MKVKSYTELLVWQKAVDLVVAVYEMTARFPKEEVYGLTSQMRRAAVSIPSNIAEGQGRHTTREFLHFLSIAHGSLQEMETQTFIAERLKYLGQQERLKVVESSGEVARLIRGLCRSLTDNSDPH